MIALAALLAVLGLSTLMATAETAARNSQAAGVQEPPKTIWDGVYTPQQAALGEQAYEQACTYCHLEDLSGGEEGAPELRGAAFFARWQDQPVSEIFKAISETMPRDSPASLSSETYAAILSFLLKKNLVPAADMLLPADERLLEQILFTTKPPNP